MRMTGEVSVKQTPHHHPDRPHEGTVQTALIDWF